MRIFVVMVLAVLYSQYQSRTISSEDHEKKTLADKIGEEIAVHKTASTLRRYTLDALAKGVVRMHVAVLAIESVLVFKNNFSSTRLEMRWNGRWERIEKGVRIEDFATLTRRALYATKNACGTCNASFTYLCRRNEILLNSFLPLYDEARFGQSNGGLKTGINKISKILPLPDAYDGISEWREKARHFEKDYYEFAEFTNSIMPNQKASELWCLATYDLDKGIILSPPKTPDDSLAVHCQNWATQASNDPGALLRLCNSKVWGEGTINDNGIKRCMEHTQNLAQTSTVPEANKPSSLACLRGCLGRLDEICYYPFSQHLPPGEWIISDTEASQTCSDWATQFYIENQTEAAEVCSGNSTSKISPRAHQLCEAHLHTVKNSKILRIKPKQRGCRTACLKAFEKQCRR